MANVTASRLSIDDGTITWDDMTIDGTLTATAVTSSGIITATSSSSGDYVRMYGSSGTGKWDIYGNGANLRISDNESAGLVVIDRGMNIGGNVDLQNNSLSNVGAAGMQMISGEMRVGGNTGKFVAPYTDAGTAYAGTFGWNHLNLGNNAINYLIAGQSSTGGDFYFVVNNTSTITTNGSGHNGIVAMTIDNAGSVGIGTTAPASLFALGSARSAWKTINFQDNDNSNAIQAYVASYNTGASDGFLRLNGLNNMQFRTGDTDRMYIDSSGNVGIGDITPDALVKIQNSDGAAMLKLERTSGNTGTAEFTIGGGDPGLNLTLTGTSSDFTVVSGGSERFRINSNGWLQFGNLVTTGAATFNEAAGDLDFRVESSGNNSVPSAISEFALVVDADEDHVGIGQFPETAWHTGYFVLGIGAKKNSISTTVTSNASDWFSFNHNAYLNASNSWIYQDDNSAGASNMYFYGGQIRFRVATAGTAGNSFTWTNAMNITDTGLVSIGHTSPAALLDVAKAAADTSSFLTESSDSGQGPNLRLRRSRASNLASPTAVQSSNWLGKFSFAGHDGGGYDEGPMIRAATSETWSASAHGSYLSFWTVDNTTTTQDERMRIDAAGNVGIGVTPAHKLHVEGGSGTRLYVRANGAGDALIDVDGYNDTYIIMRHNTVAQWSLTNGVTSSADSWSLYNYPNNFHALTVTQAGNWGIGVAPNSNYGVHIDKTFTATGFPAQFRVSGQITGAVNNEMHVITMGSNTLIEAASGTHVLASGMALYAPTLTTSGGATTSFASTLYIGQGMTGATNNYALFVDAGVSRFDGGLNVSGNTYWNNADMYDVGNGNNWWTSAGIHIEGAQVDHKIVLKSTGTNSYPTIRFFNDTNAWRLYGCNGAHNNSVNWYDDTNNRWVQTLTTDGNMILGNYTVTNTWRSNEKTLELGSKANVIHGSTVGNGTDWVGMANNAYIDVGSGAWEGVYASYGHANIYLYNGNIYFRVDQAVGANAAITWQMPLQMSSSGLSMGAFPLYDAGHGNNYWTSSAFYTTGTIYATGAITQNSDVRLKENIVQISSALDKVNQMRGVTYDLIETGEAGVGVIAQELELIAPELIHIAEPKNFDKKDSEEWDDYKSVAYGNLTAYLIEAVKELTEKVDKLERQLGG